MTRRYFGTDGVRGRFGEEPITTAFAEKLGRALVRTLGGTPVVAVERAKITKLSGRDPAFGADQQVGIYGWSIHYQTPLGYRYFSTHYGYRVPLMVGQTVDAGERLGTIGHWPGDPGRSHLHKGVTSPLGERDARKRILAVANAPRVRAT